MTRIDPQTYFLSRYRIEDTGCWHWTGSYFQNGYAYFKCKAFGPPMAAARASYMLHHQCTLGRWDFVCHTCDNPKCVNPAHLFVGKPKDNVHDMMHKDRISWGEGRPAAKLTIGAVEAIRFDRNRGQTYDQLAARYGVSKSTIAKVCTGESWSRA